MAKPRLIAFYLPQYHPIPENDEWWGKGFTEWTNVKKAKPLFHGHNQPRIPLNKNYYDLMKPETFQWQTDLAKKYNIDGFCFYHYWFDGKLLLEKPLELWLNHPEFDREYCFSWANEPWTRSWDGLNKSILMPQNYNGEKDIVAHFNYMLPFFKDSRYIKINNKPVFVLYRANSITYLEGMIKSWNELAVKSGFDGVFFVETLSHFQREKISEQSGATVFFEPMYSATFKSIVAKCKDYLLNIAHSKKYFSASYEAMWKLILKNEKISRNAWAGAFVDWDNSPRKSKGASLFGGQTSLSFNKFFKLAYGRAKTADCLYIFINAWNEWAEGTYLEPDEKNQYSYLNSIKLAVETIDE